MNDPKIDPVLPPLPHANGRARRVAAGATAIILLGYAGLFRWLFATKWLEASGGVVSLSFIWSVPFALGALSVALGRMRGSDRWLKHAVWMPIVVLAVGLAICLLTKLEAMICILMAAPVLLAASVLGGLLAHALLPRNRPDQRIYVTLAVFLPFLAAYFESSARWPTEMKAIENSIVIHAPPEAIWAEIASVSAIPSEMIPERWIYRVGFPKPIAATLDREGVGGVRTATFERGVSFFEVVTRWEPPYRLQFNIHADPEFIPHTAFDKHIIVGGRFYNVLDGNYEIERLGATTCRLHLTSRHRLGTRFNSYAAWWSVRIMDQIQGSILEVIRARAEANAVGPLKARN